MFRIRPRSWTLACWQVALGTAAVLVVLALGQTDLENAGTSIRPLLPVVAFLVSVLVVARVCAAEGLFDAVGARIGAAGTGSPTVLLALSFVTAAVVTSVLNLDATVVLLTPVLIAAACRHQQSPRPAAWAAVRLANSASTLFPVSNLTNLLAFSATGLSFLRFSWFMAPVWLTTLALEWVVTRLAFARELREPGGSSVDPLAPIPRIPLVVVALMLVSFAVGSPLRVDPAWPAAVAAVFLIGYGMRRGRLTSRELVSSAGLPLAYFIVCWAVVVEVVAASPIGDRLAELLPPTAGLGDLITISVVSMLLANLVNNLPATLLLVPLVAPVGAVGLLAMLIGVNVGANLTYVGSLANILWLDVVGSDRPSGRRFHAVALASTPVIVIVGTIVVWAWTSLIG